MRNTALSKGTRWFVALLLISSGLSFSAYGQSTKQPWEELDRRVNASENIAPLDNDLFGDKVGLERGDLSFANIDVSLPGNNALPVAITRTLAVNLRRGYRNDAMAADWDIDVPNISGVFATEWVTSGGSTNRCAITSYTTASPPAVTSGVLFQPYDYWQGLTLNIPDGGGELLLMNSASPRPATGGPYYWVTSKLAAVSCLPSIANGSGQGFLAISANGTKYWFNWMAQYYEPALQKTAEGTTTTGTLNRRRNVLYATRVEDRFGNSVTYTYTNTAAQPAKLTRILASDGRQIIVNYNSSGQIASLTDGTRIWTYQYGSVSISGGTYKTLTAVVLPDQSKWTLDFASFSQTFIPKPLPDEGSWSCLYPPEPPPVADKIGTITHPSGAIGSFTVGIKRHGFSNVPTTCLNSLSDKDDQQRMAYVNARPIAWDAFSLKQKQISGPGLATLSWNYSYSSTISSVVISGTRNMPVCSGNYCPPPTCISDSCAGTSFTTIAGPTQKLTYAHGNSYEYNEGKLLQITVAAPGTSSALRSEVRGYDLTRSQQAYPPKFGTSPRYYHAGFTSEYFRPQLSTSVTQSSSVYTREVNSFDNLARELSVTRGNDFSSSRTDVTVYQDDSSRWVLGLVKSSTNSDTGLIESSIDYNGTSLLPDKIYAFGLPQRTLTYSPDGTLATVKDPLNRSIVMSQWKRGAPQRIDYADGAFVTAIVNDQGWVSSRTDERSSLTAYGYDPMGRIGSVTYPTGDSVVWANPTYTYVQLTAPELGIPVGSWRSRKILGSFQRSVYHDAQWRPILSEDKDIATGQAYYVRNSYDADGRKTFEAYRSTDSAASAGINSKYDPLGRLISRQTTDGVMLETISYLSGNRKQITDADGNATTISYQAFDQPGEGSPLVIASPEGQTTTISRDVFGKITSVTQSGLFAGSALSATRSFQYDSNQRICRRIDPESGSTVWAYNAASEVIWEAKGQSGTGCPSIAPAGATAFEYWPRGGKKKDDYPGTAEDVSYGYDASLNLTSVGNAIATWTYSYNKRNLLETEQAVVDGKTFLLDPSYNSLGQTVGLITPRQTFAYAPDALGRPTQVGSTVSSIQYHPNDLPSDYTLGNGLSYKQILDSRLRPQAQETRNGSTLIQRFVYGYSAGGNLLSIDDTVSNTDDLTASYDDLHRLIAAAGLWGSYGFTYDPLNNIRARTGASALNYSYGTDNRLASVTGVQSRTYTYNVKGEITNDGVKPAVLNNQGQIISVSSIVDYAYDGNGKRIKIVKDGVTEYTLYDRSGALVYTESGSTGTDFIRVGGQMVAELKKVGTTTTASYLHPDLLGSPRMATSSSKAILWQEHYDPYGKKLNSVAETIGYTGHAYDPETGYTYMQARYYDPLVGRFYSADPVYFSDSSSYTFNRYSYANNNPYRYKDPSGQIVETVWDVANVAMDVASLGGNLASGNYVGAAVDFVALVVDGGAAVIPGAPGGAGAAIKASRVTTKELRNTQRSKFAASKAIALTENGGKCVYCGKAKATVGEHINALKFYAGKVNAGEMTKLEAAQAAHAPGNIAGACFPCNAAKSANQLSATPGVGKFVPTDPSPRIEDLMRP